MSVINSQPLIGAGGQGGGYNLTKSLRFRSSASAYLSRTPASATNRQTWTLSAWVKRGILSATQFLFDATAGVGTRLYFTSSDVLQFDTGGSGVFTTTQVFRDPSAWYHIVFVADTTQATDSNRIKLYINGTQVTAFSATSYPAQNTNMDWNNNVGHYFGRNGNASVSYLDGYLAEINNIDGQALTPSSFGETSTTTGVWIPKKYTGTYGTNGFYLPFTDTTSTSTLGTDFSGNSNTWTTNNISLTSGSTYDSMTDVPTLTSATVANYSVLDPLDPTTSGNATLSNANLTLTTSAANRSRVSSIGITNGKWYAEVVFSTSSGSLSGCMVGISQSGDVGSVVGSYLGSTANSYGYNQSGDKYNNGGSSAYGASYTNNDVIGIAFDADNGTVTFYKNNSSQGTAFSSLSTSATWFIGVSGGISSGSSNIVIDVNFGQRPFSYTPPTGFVALNTFNLPTPTIGATASTTANKYMDITLYTGNGSTQTITGVGFQPDFTWIKGRSVAADHYLADAVRGATKQLISNSTAAEATNNGLTAFTSNGFSVGAIGDTNTNVATFVGWNWKANGSGSTNTAGSITSTVSANTTAGFSIVTYTGTGANATVGHGLGAVPAMIMIKNRDSGAIGGAVYHTSIGATKYLKLFQTTTGSDQEATDNTAWNGSSPTFNTNVFSVGSLNRTNSAQQMVAYCFAPIAGYSAFGSYTGNGATDGSFIYTGFRPRFIMIKRSDSSDDWIMMDSSRSTYNVAILTLYANGAFAEDSNVTNRAEDFLSNGFKIRSSPTYLNASGGTYIYMAFAESPFKYANAR